MIINGEKQKCSCWSDLFHDEEDLTWLTVKEWWEIIACNWCNQTYEVLPSNK